MHRSAGGDEFRIQSLVIAPHVAAMPIGAPGADDSMGEIPRRKKPRNRGKKPVNAEPSEDALDHK